MTNKSLETMVYVQLFHEGIPCWTAVPALPVSEDEYILEGNDIYDPDVEIWQFLPGTRVRVQKHYSGSGKVPDTHLRAVTAVDGIAYIGDFGITGSAIHSVSRYADRLIVVFVSGGYGRPSGALFHVTFSQVTGVSDNSTPGQVVLGVCEFVKPGQPRIFSVMSNSDTACIKLTAATYSIGDYAVGDDAIKKV
ncbi:MAG TPA: hypothetical protein V6C72_13890 [Chroococcales cyanobacterium]